MMVLAHDFCPRYTYDDYIKWEGRWELINGLAYAMTPTPSIQHQELCGKIFLELSRLLEDCQQCTVLLPVDWKIDEYTVIQPDNLVICNKEITEQYLTEPPAMVFEVLSPSTKQKDRIVKFKIYEEQGVKYYILVDVKGNFAEVYQLIAGKYSLAGEFRDEVYRFDIDVCKLDFDFSRLFS